MGSAGKVFPLVNKMRGVVVLDVVHNAARLSGAEKYNKDIVSMCAIA